MKVSGKELIVMVACMVLVLVLGLALSGVFSPAAQYRDVLSISHYSLIAENSSGWKLYMPEKEDLSLYIRNDSDQPSSSKLSLVIYIYDDNQLYTYEGYPMMDRHFFFGEGRYFLPKEIVTMEKLKDKTFAIKISYSKYGGGELNDTYIYSENLTDKQKTEVTVSSYL